MQHAAIPGFKLSRSRLSVRVLTSLGLIAVFLGLLSAVGMTLAKTGLSTESVQKYYLGVTVAGGLDQMLELNTPRSFGELAEVTHLHLIGGSMLLFFLSHLLSLCEMSERSRIMMYCLAFGSFVCTFGLPWLIIYLSPGFAVAFGPSIILFVSSLLLLVTFPLREMWFRKQQ